MFLKCLSNSLQENQKRFSWINLKNSLFNFNRSYKLAKLFKLIKKWIINLKLNFERDIHITYVFVESYERIKPCALINCRTNQVDNYLYKWIFWQHKRVFPSIYHFLLVGYGNTIMSIISSCGIPIMYFSIRARR